MPTNQYLDASHIIQNVLERRIALDGDDDIFDVLSFGANVSSSKEDKAIGYAQEGVRVVILQVGNEEMKDLDVVALF
ncbi:hypothetical protein Tco_1082362 [Tanacetum coccineum]|uniref:Uncharacterized protein n=1 Tax=Tanacetum coccineum TaxID=301880 RepID=A0ABQ5I2C4_9ASTR